MTDRIYTSTLPPELAPQPSFMAPKPVYVAPTAGPLVSAPTPALDLSVPSITLPVMPSSSGSQTYLSPPSSVITDSDLAIDLGARATAEKSTMFSEEIALANSTKTLGDRITDQESTTQALLKELRGDTAVIPGMQWDEARLVEALPNQVDQTKVKVFATQAAEASVRGAKTQSTQQKTINDMAELNKLSATNALVAAKELDAYASSLPKNSYEQRNVTAAANFTRAYADNLATKSTEIANRPEIQDLVKAAGERDLKKFASLMGVPEKAVPGMTPQIEQAMSGVAASSTSVSKSAADTIGTINDYRTSISNTTNQLRTSWTDEPGWLGMRQVNGIGETRVNPTAMLALTSMGLSMYGTLYAQPKENEKNREFQKDLRDEDFQRNKEMLELKYGLESGLLAQKIEGEESAKGHAAPARNPNVRL